MANVRTSIEAPRGCGFRKGGGIYLVTDPQALSGCGKLPIPLEICPCCSQGIKPARGWTWVESGPLFDQRVCHGGTWCDGCPLSGMGAVGRAGLLWIGERFYPSPADWVKEAMDMGVSRRIKTIPKGFEVGEHWVLVAHRKAITRFDLSHQPLPEHTPGIFHAFRPKAIEYVINGTETEEELDRLEARGLSLVKVIPQTEQTEMEANR